MEELLFYDESITPPTNLRVEHVSADAATIYWDYNRPDITGCIIKKKEIDDKNFSEIAVIGKDINR
jgi:hypothetical protein